MCHFVNLLVELVACVVNNKKLLSLPRTLRGLGLLDSGSVHQGSDWAHTLTLSGREVGPIVFSPLRLLSCTLHVRLKKSLIPIFLWVWVLVRVLHGCTVRSVRGRESSLEHVPSDVVHPS